MTWFLHICALVFVPAWQMSVDTVRMIELIIPLWVRIITGVLLFFACILIMKYYLRCLYPMRSLIISIVAAASMICPWILFPALMVVAPFIAFLASSFSSINSHYLRIALIVYLVYIMGWAIGSAGRRYAP